VVGIFTAVDALNALDTLLSGLAAAASRPHRAARTERR
jgi:hypothetical protein